MSRYKELFRDTAIFAIGSIGTKLILFLMVPLYTNYMSSAEYGTADLIFTIAQLMTSFLSIVIFDAVIRFGLSAEKNAKMFFCWICRTVFLGNFWSHNHASNWFI